MSPALRSSSPPPNRSRPRHSPNPNSSSFHLNNLPRFHPAVYQSSPKSSKSKQIHHQPPSPLQSRPQPSRIPSGSREALRQYRELVASMAAASRNATPSISVPKPSKPRLDPLGSPGPVTPLALEDEDLEGGYFAGQGGVHGGVRPEELMQKLIQRENERIAMQNGVREKSMR
ncbi:hypothetical protein AJ80_02819 [Polytolypa hystricis UAMH7299]|uniref:Uncharacterized protein n=1 Tax=Polytolypa hystricis (strain UAMH7299) TaxID=1447883 RepID=A0A2B7YN52_POLH7|nr:hypothetical protein AJ80_02819 [Polytolypa hystricis UAMH7299]